MKKILAVLLVCVLMFAMVACGDNTDKPVGSENDTSTSTPVSDTTDPVSDTTEPVSDTTEAVDTTAPDGKSEGVMTYAEYVAAEIDTQVVIETYVQATQGWWENEGQGVITAYTQDEDGAYFLYNMACAEEDAAKLVPGAKIKVTGYKAEWSGEIEIVDATFELLEGEYIAEALDVTAMLGTDELAAHQNEFVSFKGMTVVASQDADGNDVAFLYNHDGSGQKGSDLYFKVSAGETVYTFTVESYLCGPDTDVYAAVEALQIGDVIDMTGFLYWYNGANPHIVSVAAAN